MAEICHHKINIKHWRSKTFYSKIRSILGKRQVSLCGKQDDRITYNVKAET